ncbi:MAG: hypothetical protein GX660_15530 [Clostridiaceae bacterium]|nr:hypothetical protein [Clostridiaceae bacterium]
MISKYLERRVELKHEEGICNDGIELEYYLIESEPKQFEENFGGKVYGIEIVKKAKESSIESKIIRNLSYDRQNTHNMVCYLAENIVTPVELSFVLDDLMGV